MDQKPVIICPYLDESDADKVAKAFGLSEARGSKLEVFLWQDKERIGPERAFQHCWSCFPKRDIIIIHPDMSPMPDDTSNRWFDALTEYGERFPDAAIIACDLLYPEPMADGRFAVQSAGGVFCDGAIKHIHSRHLPYDQRFRFPRKVAWATFGGVFIKRRAIEACGPIDERYNWAYVMDVDYCLEVRKRGFEIYQVPVPLIHEENGTTKRFLEDESYWQKIAENYSKFYSKWETSRLLQMDHECCAAHILHLDARESELIARRLAEAESRITQLESSWSWRITAPCRALADRLKQQQS